jgi:hypothetical protein
MCGVSDELVRVNAERLVFSETVVRMAQALHPLGPAAQMVAETCALGIELKRLSLEGKQLEADRIEGLARLDERRASVDASFGLAREQLAASRAKGEEVSDALRAVQRRFVDPRTPLDEKRMCVEMLPVLARELTNHTEVEGKIVNKHTDDVLNGRGGAGPQRRRGKR